jgi:hypothetical protein
VTAPARHIGRMDFEDRPWEPALGAFRVHFRTTEPLAEPEREALLRDLAADSPRPPNEGHIGPEGRGWLHYDGESLTASDREQIASWLRAHPHLRAIVVESVPD